MNDSRRWIITTARLFRKLVRSLQALWRVHVRWAAAWNFVSIPIPHGVVIAVSCSAFCYLGVVHLILLFAEPEGAGVPASAFMFCAALAAVAYLDTLVLRALRPFHLSVTDAWLNTTRDLRDEQEREAQLLLENIERSIPEEVSDIWQYLSANRQRLVRRRFIRRGSIYWIILDVDPKGMRVLARPLFAETTVSVLIGRDTVNGHPFFMPAPSHIRTASAALDWLWNLPQGTFQRTDIYET